MQWYGAEVSEFETVSNAFLSLTSMERGSTKFIESMWVVSHGFTVVFTTSFSVIVTLFVYASMLATLKSTYSSVRHNIFHYSPTNTRDYEMTGFLIKQLKKWLGVTKAKPVNYHSIIHYCKIDKKQGYVIAVISQWFIFYVDARTSGCKIVRDATERQNRQRAHP